MTILGIRNIIAMHMAEEIKKIIKIIAIANRLECIMQNIT
jgi:hypothetical protein